MTTLRTTIIGLSRMRNSDSGNPVWRLHAVDGRSYVTEHDAAVGHAIGPHLKDRGIDLTFNADMRVIDAKLVIRVVRTDGTVEHDWMLVYEGTDRVLIQKGDDQKNPTRALFDHWQLGGMARSTRELNDG